MNFDRTNGSFLTSSLASLFARPVSICVATPAMYESELWPEEVEVVKNAILRRRREFSAGRAAAREALKKLSIPPGAILASPDRSPRWPEGIVGSISHCEGRCVAVVGTKHNLASVGLDVETAEPLSPQMSSQICDTTEAMHFSCLPNPVGSNWGKLAFSAKEAFYKCYYPLTKTFLDFQGVSIGFSINSALNSGEFTIRMKGDLDQSALSIMHEFVGRWMIDDRFVYSGVVMTEAECEISAG